MSGTSTPVEQLAKLLTTTPDGLLVVDMVGYIRYANPAAHELFGRKPGALSGEPFGLPHVAGVRDIQLVQRDGGLRTVEMRAVSTSWGGEPVWVLTLRDATEQRLREEELRSMLTASSELTSELTHELATPLTVIIGLTDVLETRWEELSEPQRRDLNRRVGAQARRLHRMIQRMLLAGRDTAPAPGAAPGPVDLWEVALSHLADLGVSNVEIDCPQSLQVLADPSHVDEIVMNLVENATKYGEPPITVRARRTGAMVELAVCDHGAGVPETFVPHLFERHSRAETTLRQRSGVGLGLYIVAKLARASGGDVRYQPNRPHGACFVVRLPAV